MPGKGAIRRRMKKRHLQKIAYDRFWKNYDSNMKLYGHFQITSLALKHIFSVIDELSYDTTHTTGDIVDEINEIETQTKKTSLMNSYNLQCTFVKNLDMIELNHIEFFINEQLDSIREEYDEFEELFENISDKHVGIRDTFLEFLDIMNPTVMIVFLLYFQVILFEKYRLLVKLNKAKEMWDGDSTLPIFYQMCDDPDDIFYMSLDDTDDIMYDMASICYGFIVIINSTVTGSLNLMPYKIGEMCDRQNTFNIYVNKTSVCSVCATNFQVHYLQHVNLTKCVTCCTEFDWVIYRLACHEVDSVKVIDYTNCLVIDYVLIIDHILNPYSSQSWYTKGHSHRVDGPATVSIDLDFDIFVPEGFVHRDD